MTDTHEHPHPVEAQPEPGGGAILDIGGDVGALLLHTSAEWLEREIHVAPVADPAHRTHTVSRGHPLPSGGTTHAALFPALPAGDYRIVGGDSQILTIRGGEVTEHELRAPAPATSG